MRRVVARIALLACAGVSAGAQADPTLFATVPALEVEPTWRWVAGAAAGGLVLGFVLGWRMLDRRIRKKYGGLRIY